MNQVNINEIPAEKFQFETRNDLSHDSKFSTKPVSYFQGAFRRFSKNKGAVVGGIVIAFLVLFAIAVPFFTPFRPIYYDMMYAYVTPKNKLFADNGADFWDGCRVKDTNLVGYLKDRALAEETGREVIKRGEYTVSEEAADTINRNLLADGFEPDYTVGDVAGREANGDFVFFAKEQATAGPLMICSAGVRGSTFIIPITAEMVSGNFWVPRIAYVSMQDSSSRRHSILSDIGKAGTDAGAALFHAAHVDIAA